MAHAAHQAPGHKNPLEWSVFAISLLLITAILVYLAYIAITYKSTPADIRVEYKASPTKTAPYLYHLVVSNHGGEAAERVIIEVVLKKNDEILEKAELQLRYVPTTSKREGWINFTKNPDLADSIAVRVVSFKKPN